MQRDALSPASPDDGSRVLSCLGLHMDGRACLAGWEALGNVVVATQVRDQRRARAPAVFLSARVAARSSVFVGGRTLELQRCTWRKLRTVVDGFVHELRGRTYDSFGEEAYRVQLRRV